MQYLRPIQWAKEAIFSIIFSMNKDLLIAIALDLKRVAIGLHSHSEKMANRFLEEVLNRIHLIDTSNLSISIQKVLAKITKLDPTQQRTADDALMYSTVLLSFAKQL
jgi:hypothetical protein